ncbi:MAG: hypothetical protein O2856_12060 [Planctomycetota bacterium]|nr:hypothetical protein [Planctomycetota bacterium]
MSIRPAFSWLIGCGWMLIVIGLNPALQAESKISFRQITRTYPVAVQRGKSAVVEVSSNFSLNGSHTVLFAPGGPQMKLAESAAKPDVWKDPDEGDQGTPFRFQVTVPADQLPGVYEYRIATDQSVSSVGHLLVTDYPTVLETTDDNDRTVSAQSISVPAAICGAIERFEDVDCYRLHGEAGQDLVCQIYAQQVTRAIHCMAIRYPKIHLMDAILTLLGPDGELIAQNDNSAGGDALLHCRLPVTGDYVLQVRDTRYAGDPRYVYCVEVTRNPFAHGILPMGFQPNAGTGAEWIVSRPANGTASTNTHANEKVSFTDVASNAPGWYRSRPLAASGPSNPIWFRVSSHSETLRPNDTGNPAILPLALPAGVTGRFVSPGQSHLYQFEGKQDGYYRFEVQSQRRGFDVDSVLTVLDANGKTLATGDDGYFTKDAILHFKAPADGPYTIALRDLHGRSGDLFVYHLSAEPSGPDFEIHGEFYYGMLSPGGRAIWFVSLKRLNGFDGPVEMQVDGLPQGVSFTPVTIPSGMNACSLIFTAAPDAPINASLVRVTGRSKLSRAGGAMIDAVREAHVTCELRRAGASRFYRAPIQTQVLAVTKPLDVTRVTAEPSEITLKRGGKTEFRVRIERSAEYSDQVLLDMAFTFFSTKFGEQLPPGVTMSADSKTKLVGSDLEATIVLEASPQALSVDRLPIAVLARVPITYSIMTNYASNPIQLSVVAE